MSDEGTEPETDSNILLLMFGQGDSDSLIWNILNRYMSYEHNCKYFTRIHMLHA